MHDLSNVAAQELIAAFGGLSRMARALGVPVTTVQSWRNKDRIPVWRHSAIREAAQREGVDLPTTEAA